RQRILLHVDTPRIDIQTEIEWHQRQVLLKAAFPLAVHASQATYECAFGYVQRPTHRNTSWDAARFEVAGHRWADLSETGYGVSLLNDGKYGHDCLGNVLRLTLLKSAIEPDPLADEGSHSFSYAIYPHGPDWSIEDTVRAAAAFNMPVHTRLVSKNEGLLPAGASLVTSDSLHAVVDTVKPAEDGNGLIVRVYDCANRRGLVTLTFAHPIASAVPVTILEEPDPNAALTTGQDTLKFELLPFQVRSFRIVLNNV
ncbi:MAG: alpha-mannosidase, partial [Chloroflexi bacterium]|nr:alpha-mannosidase [Chloroflexota bacterium]